MFIPLHDGEPLRHVRAAFVVYGIIALCTLLFAASEAGLLPRTDPYLAAGFGIIPKVVLGDAFLPLDLPQAPWWLTPATSLFLHGGWVHLLGNMLFLWVFADNVEDLMGHWRFALFFLLCGVCASLAHAFVNAGSTQPLIGASGAVSGVIAAYLLLFPRVQVWGLVLKYVPVRVPAFVAIGGWILFQLWQALFGGNATIGWFAHLGGVAAGLALTPFFLGPASPSAPAGRGTTRPDARCCGAAVR